MLHWFYKWRAMRELKADSYRFDKRPKRNSFGAGFHGFLEQSRFYDTNSSKYDARVRRRGWLLPILLICLLGLIGWFTYESIMALDLFK